MRGAAAVIATLVALAMPGAAHALPDCSPLPEKRTILTGQGQLESIISDRHGRIFYTDIQSGGRMFRLDRPGAEPKQLIQGISGTGGLAWDTDETLVLGFNGSTQNAIADGPAGGLLRVDPETGATTPLASGMGQSNGIVRGPDGAFYASNDFAGGIDRVVGGQVQDDWSKVQTPNGLAIDTAGRYLYAAQTFKPASVARIDLSDPSKEEPYYEAPPGDQQGGPDGMTRDDRDRLYVAVNASGEVWRIDTDRTACVLARGILNASALNWGGGEPGFPARNLYVVAFSGVLVELVDATDRPPLAEGPGPVRALRLSVSPARAARRVSTRYRFVVEVGSSRARGAIVRMGNKRVSTNASGEASLRLRYFHAGSKSVRASLPGYRSARARVRVK
ncbi:MAG: SMP-30/gluconolactonase/LRE family protein [Actinomycetota bacterium]|nr:SMP-30/gluconolactonase/LRE family protein [Actinomycetota bacterium]